MKMAWMAYVAYASIWISTALAVSTGIYVTGEGFPLFFMIIPLFVKMDTKATVETAENKKEKGD